MIDKPLVSCIMPTANRRHLVPKAIEYFLRQNYKSSELLVLDNGTDTIEDLIPITPRIRYLREEPGKYKLGYLRNILCDASQGKFIVHWDDDDWSAPWRVMYQVAQMQQSKALMCGLDHVLFFDPVSELSFEYTFQLKYPWVYGATMCYTKGLWESNNFKDSQVGCDNTMCSGVPRNRVLPLPNQRFLLSLLHDSNTSTKITDAPYSPYSSYPFLIIKSMLGVDWEFYKC